MYIYICTFVFQAIPEDDETIAVCGDMKLVEVFHNDPGMIQKLVLHIHVHVVYIVSYVSLMHVHCNSTAYPLVYTCA